MEVIKIPISFLAKHKQLSVNSSSMSHAIVFCLAIQFLIFGCKITVGSQLGFDNHKRGNIINTTHAYTTNITASSSSSSLPPWPLSSTLVASPPLMTLLTVELPNVRQNYYTALVNLSSGHVQQLSKSEILSVFLVWCNHKGPNALVY